MFYESFLQSFPALHTHDVDEVRQWLRPHYAVLDVDVSPRGRPLDFRFNHCRLPSVELTYARYGTATFHAELEQNDYFVQGFPTTGAGEVKWNRNAMVVRPDIGGISGGPGAKAILDYDEDFSNLVLKISPEVLTHRLSLLLQRPIDPPLQLTGQRNPQYAGRQRRLVMFLAREMELSRNTMSDLVIAEIEDAIIVNYLLENRHNYSDLLDGTARMVAPWQVRRAVEYMEQYWDQPITIEKLTRITETSARSLFQLFKKTYDVSPMVYLGKLRLRHAKDMLTRPAPGTSVTKVGFMCGFSNMGHFAMKYHAAFGEKPSDTLRNSLR